jgi:hypothetical protein
MKCDLIALGVSLIAFLILSIWTIVTFDLSHIEESSSLKLRDGFLATNGEQQYEIEDKSRNVNNTKLNNNRVMLHQNANAKALRISASYRSCHYEDDR